MSFAPIPKIVPVHACETVSGRYVDVVDPDPNDIVIFDIAWSLSRQARYAGHTLCDPVYSVAQHACFVEMLVDYVISDDSENDPLRDSFNDWMVRFQIPFHEQFLNLNLLRMLALCHDNTEAYLVDLPSPVKRHPALREPYKELESRLNAVIQTALGIQRPEWPEHTHVHHTIVTWADMMALQIEAANLMPSRGRGWGADFPKFDLSMMQWMPRISTWRQANHEFLTRYEELAKALGINEFTYKTPEPDRGISRQIA
jgi:hypothetical protein